MTLVRSPSAQCDKSIVLEELKDVAIKGSLSRRAKPRWHQRSPGRVGLRFDHGEPESVGLEIEKTAHRLREVIVRPTTEAP